MSSGVGSQNSSSTVDPQHLLDEVAQTAFMALTDNEGAMGYLSHRKINADSVAKWKMGLLDVYARNQLSQKYGLDSLLQIGLTPVFYDRLILPMTDTGSRICGFVGRSLTGEAPKWVYSPESYLLSRRSHLFGFDRYLEYCRLSYGDPDLDRYRLIKPPIVVEGPFDAVQLWQSGIPSVGSHGTGFTKEQALMLRNAYPHKCYICPDPEPEALENYRKAVDRWRSSLPDEILEIPLPLGYDPDKFVQDFGHSRFEELLESAHAI